MEKLKYGLRGDELIHIDDVENGLACNCLCPYCKTQLIAKKGDERVRHFAHYKVVDCNRGGETALHLMAKSIVEQTRKVYVPLVPKTEYDFLKRGIPLEFERAVLEEKLSDAIRGDVVLYQGKNMLNVEIKVTHEVDLKKCIELFNLEIPTIEVDLSDIKSNFTSNMIKELLLNGEKTKLISSPRNKAIYAKYILGEWKKVYNAKYVKDCPCSRDIAYFVDYNGKGGRSQCHECDSYRLYDENGEKFLCLEWLGDIDFGKIEKILYLEKEGVHIREVRLLMNDGSVIERISYG